MKSLTCSGLFFLAMLNISYSQIQWEHLNGPEGSLHSYIFSNDEFAFIPENDFLFRSADGIHWEKIVREVSDFMFVYHDTLINALWNNGQNTMHLQLSYNNGYNWVVQNLPAQVSDYGDLVMCSHGIYFAQGNKSKIFRSIDLGQTWDSLSTPGIFTNMKSFEDRIYIYSDSIMWRTDQAGETWIDITPPRQPFEYLNDLLARDSHIIVSSIENIFLSSNNGESWDIKYAFSPNPFDKMTFVGDDIYLNVFDALIRSKDFGIHWDTLVTRFYSHAISLTGLRNIFLGTTYDSGVIRWDEVAGAIVESNEGLSKGAIYDLSYGANKIWAACGNGVFAYDIPSDSWSEKIDLPDPIFEYRFVSANEIGWVVTADEYQDRFYFSQNQGLTWDTIQPGHEILDIQLVDEYMYMFYNRLYRSTDKGLHWDTLDFTILSNEIISFKDKKYLLGPGHLYTTEDNGLNWNTTSTFKSFLKLYAYEDKMYAIDSDLYSYTDFYVSEDAINWERIDDGLPHIDPFTLWYRYHPLFFRDANFHYAFLGPEGHYISTDNALSWAALETTQRGTDYLIHENVIYLGREGLYRSLIENPFVTAIHNPENVSEKLFRISPNPASESINIRFDIDNSGMGLLQIFTPDGILLKSMAIEGKQNINISIGELPAGLYYVLFTGQNGSGVELFVRQK